MRSIDISSVNLSPLLPKQRMQSGAPSVEQPTPKAKEKERVLEAGYQTQEADSCAIGAEEAKEKNETASHQDKIQRIAERARKRREAKAAEEAAE